MKSTSVYNLSEPVEVGNEIFRAPDILGSDSFINNIYSNIQVDTDAWIETACFVAIESVKNSGGPFGALILQVDDISDTVLRYWTSGNQVTKANDPTAHAEIMAIRSACASLGVFNLGVIRKDESRLPQPGETSHCIIYSSCEPCPMCYSAIYWARIPALYFAATRFDASEPGIGFSDKEIYDDLQVPYSERKIKVFQSLTSQANDAFELWRKMDKTEY
jgi:guanine deaminase